MANPDQQPLPEVPEAKPTPGGPNTLPPHLLVVWGEAGRSLTKLLDDRDAWVLRSDQIELELERIRSTEEQLHSDQVSLRKRIESSHDTERALRKVKKFLEDQCECEPEPTDPVDEPEAPLRARRIHQLDPPDNH